MRRLLVSRQVGELSLVVSLEPAPAPVTVLHQVRQGPAVTARHRRALSGGGGVGAPGELGLNDLLCWESQADLLTLSQPRLEELQIT